MALTVVTIIGMLLSCQPLRHNWGLPVQDNECFNTESFLVTMAAVGVALDLLTWITPHYVVWHLQLRRAHKLAITVIFAFGILFENTIDSIAGRIDDGQDYRCWRFSYRRHHEPLLYGRCCVRHRHQLALGSCSDEYGNNCCMFATLASGVREGSAKAIHTHQQTR